MIPLLIVASLTTMLTSTGSGAPGSADHMVREAANGQFISEHYPPQALKRGEQGRVGFRLTIEPDGSIGACSVTESSGYANLDKETCDIMVRYARTKPVRNAEGRSIRTTSPGHIIWKLPANVTKVASATPGPSTNGRKSLDPDEVVCKRIQATGSLIAKKKQCLTRSQWAQQERITRDEIERIQGRGNMDCKSGGTC